MFGPMFKLSRRMNFVFDHLIHGKPVWDLCCDHGYVGLNAYESGLFPEVNFVDQVPHIIDNLKTRFQAEYFQAEHSQKAFFWPQDGGTLPQVQGTMIITGVGAIAILKILRSISSNNNLQASRLILGPHRDEILFESELLNWPEFQKQYQLEQKYEIQEGRRSRILFIFNEVKS